jgi:hypothetical protein
MLVNATRRDLFAGFALAAWTLPVVARAQGSGALGWTPKALNAGQARTLSAAAETIMPATDTPGAAAVGVPQFIDRALADWCRPADAARLKAGLTDLDARAKAQGASSFEALAPDRRAAMLTAVEAEAVAAAKARPPQPHWWPLLKELATTGYFTSEIGATKALRYDAFPKAYHGCVPLKDIGRTWATS